MHPSPAEKDAGVHTSATQHGPVQPQDFLPTYEQTLNDNLRKWVQPDGQANIKEFELEEQAPKKRRVPDLRKYWRCMLVLATLITVFIVLAISWGSGAFKQHPTQDQVTSSMLNVTTSTSTAHTTTQSPLHTRAEVTQPDSTTLMTTVFVTVFDTMPLETVTATTHVHESQSPVSTEAPCDTNIPFACMSSVTSLSTVQATSTATVDIPSSSTLATFEAPLTLPQPSTTTLVSVTTLPPTTVMVTATPPPPTTAPALATPTPLFTARGSLYYCGPAGVDCT